MNSIAHKEIQTSLSFFKKIIMEKKMDLNIEIIEESVNSVEVLCNSVGCP